VKTTPPVPDLGSPLSSKRKFSPILLAFALLPMNLFAWTNGELLIWMDNDRAKGLAPVAQKFEHDFGIKITIDTPEKITDTFPMAAQAAKGPDIVVWALDKVGEWADAGLIASVEVSGEFSRKFFPKAWQAILRREWIWGYPIGLETVTLIYNRNLMVGPPPADLSELITDQPRNQNAKSRSDSHPLGLQERVLFVGNSRECWRLRLFQNRHRLRLT
jgi:maltose/maltodextrin transport system substrate-binding protein